MILKLKSITLKVIKFISSKKMFKNNEVVILYKTSKFERALLMASLR